MPSSPWQVASTACRRERCCHGLRLRRPELIASIMTTLQKVTASLALTLSLSTALFAAEKTAPPAPTSAKLKPYTLKTCVVSDEELGAMGDPVLYKYKGREIKFCCKGCQKDFDKDPAKFTKKLETAEKKAAPAKPASGSPDHNAHSH